MRSATGKSWKGLALTGGAILGMLAVWLGQPDDNASIEPAVSVQPAEPARFGPGAWMEPAPEIPVVETLAFDTLAPGGLVATPDNRLVVNKALKDVADYFLLGGHPGSRATHAAALLAHLQSALPLPAADEATQIVRNYLAYLDEHDKLLARDPMPSAQPDSMHLPPDVDRIGAWLAQRARLRQDLLGMQVAAIWFGEEEASDQQALTAMRERHGAAAPLAQPADGQDASTVLQAMRANGTTLQAQRAYVASSFGEEAAQRYETIESKEQAWKARYAAYRRAAEQVLRQPGIDPLERTRQVEALREQAFTAEHERLRARNLDTLPAPG